MFYAVLLSPLQPKQSVSKQFQSVLSRNMSSYERMISIVNLVDQVIPGSISRLSRWIFNNSRFPWVPVDKELLAFGTGAAVFKLARNNEYKVLRIYRRSLGKSRPSLVEVANYYKKNYETVVAWYGDIAGLVLPMDFFVFEGFPLIGPVAASFQPYVQGQKYDLFEDFSDNDLLKLFESSNFLREQFVLFANQTIQQWNGRKLCYDFLGRENVMLVKQDGNYRLNIVDVGIFKFDFAEHNTPDKVALIERRIERLATLYKQAKQIC
jgi:hypothetical protein